ncbi:MAG: TIGR03086 family metal-binding protein [Kibdelosporangium sp.]
MSPDQLIKRATAPVLDLDIKPDQLGLATPCADFTVRQLLNHLLFWGPSLAGAARKATVPPPAESESDVDMLAGDWVADFRAQLETLTVSWSRPEAWAGVTHMGGPTELPAALVGGMVVGEVLVHGWDLGQATGQRPSWDAELLAYLHKEVEATHQMGRDMGIYGPEVPVPADAPILDRILGRTGRDPQWTG